VISVDIETIDKPAVYAVLTFDSHTRHNKLFIDECHQPLPVVYDACILQCE